MKSKVKRRNKKAIDGSRFAEYRARTMAQRILMQPKAPDFLR